MKNMKKESRKGQVTVFVIIAVVIIAAVAGVLLMRGGVGTSVVPVPAEFKIIQDGVGNCLKNASLEGIYFIGLQGGYYNVPEPKENYEFLNIPVYLNKGVKAVPSETIIEGQLKAAMNDSLTLCLNNFNSYKAQGYSFDGTNIKSLKTDISGDKIITTLDWPVAVKKGESTYILRSFRQETNFDFPKKYNLVKQFVDEQAKDMQAIPISYMANLAYDNDFLIETIELTNTTTLYTFAFNETYGGQEYLYNFVVKY